LNIVIVVVVIIIIIIIIAAAADNTGTVVFLIKCCYDYQIKGVRWAMYVLYIRGVTCIKC